MFFEILKDLKKKKKKKKKKFNALCKCRTESQDVVLIILTKFYCKLSKFNFLIPNVIF